jgi:hypothetical protein
METIILVSALGGILFGYDWVSNRRLALLFETKIAEGSVQVSDVNLVNDLENRSETWQLLNSLQKYMSSQNFNPDISLTINQVKKIKNKLITKRFTNRGYHKTIANYHIAIGEGIFLSINSSVC